MKISIITITYNSEETLEETIKSIIAQNYINLEYIIIDGLSSDKTLDIIKKYSWFISKFISERDHGISDAFNKGISIATGELIGIINSDDILLPNALNVIARKIPANADVIYAKGFRLLKNGKLVEYKQKNIENLYSCMALLHPAVFIRKKCYIEHGLFDINLKACMDRELLLRYYDKGLNFYFLNEFVAVYRMGGESETSYFNTTIHEREKISTQYGMSKIVAKYQTLFAYLKMKIVFFINSQIKQ